MATQTVTAPIILDSTGQAIVTALQDLVSNVKPDATEINMGPSDDTKVATAIASANTAITNLNLTKTSVSNANADLANGIYYTTSASQNVPYLSGVLFNLVASGSATRRMQITVDETHISQRYGKMSNGNLVWESWQQLALKSDVFVSGEPTSVATLTSGTAKTVSITADGWYIVRALNTTTSGICNSAVWSDSARTKIIGSVDSGTGTYIRAVCGPYPLKSGTSITVLANFTGSGDVCKLS